jgi:diguanylate cyclase (GGDEF)-like protein
LTGLKTYEVFAREFAVALAEAANDEGCVSMALFDIDWFKRVNDEHGRDVGDAVIKAVAGHLSDQLNVEKAEGLDQASEARRDFGSLQK